MQTSFDLRNAIVTQKSKSEVLIYDRVQQGIDEAIHTLKDKHKNAIVRNIAYYIQEQLVVAQIFVNRLNGFVPTEEAKFGTTPTAYHIQLRFVHGFEAHLGQEPVFISNGSFTWDNLAPREIQDHIIDDVYHEMSLINGSNVTVENTPNELSLVVPSFPAIKVKTSHEEGKGYETFPFGRCDRKTLPKHYLNYNDYGQRHKFNAVYAIFYLQPDNTPICRVHAEYRGFTQAQQYEHEPRDAQATTRYQNYQTWTQDISTILRQHPVTANWVTNHQRSATKAQPYRLDILSINGMHLYTDSGLLVDRLYDYQVELMNLLTQVYQRIRENNRADQLPSIVHASIVDMGVGAGKTYIINSVLKYLSRYYQDPHYAPAFCMTPDTALANVMVRVVNKQDGLGQIRSHAISSADDIPNSAFLQRYQDYSQTAVQEISAIRQYINEELQNSVLEYCRNVGLHPFMIMNALYDSFGHRKLYQNSIDIKRILLLIEGQKLIMQKTGLSPLLALRRLYDELEKIILAVDKEKRDNSSLFHGIDTPITPYSPYAQIIYDQEVELPSSLRTDRMTHINLKQMTANKLEQLLLTKFSYKTGLQQSVAIRDVLLKIACLSDVKAAILLANGGGLANTHTQAELTAQIKALLEPAARELRRGAQERQTPMTYLEHRTFYLYLNELFATIPQAINSKNRYSYDYDSPHLLQTALQHNYQLLHRLREQIAAQLARLSSPQEVDMHLGATIIESVDHMAGQMGLLLSGRIQGDSAKLMSTHVPIFTPEGFVAYLEHLVASEGQPSLHIQYQEGVYLAQPDSHTITRASIQQRIIQVFSAVMLADEIHKEAYQFFYDPQHPLYQRVNRITCAYLKQEFATMLPHRIGMSGTVNQIARKSFGNHTLYSLPLQDMIQRQLTKDIQITSLRLDSSQGLFDDYFKGHGWWKVSKGILFAKQTQPDLISNLHQMRALEQDHLQALRNQLMVHYLDFVLQKSGAPKELSEIVGLQNKLYAKGASLIDAFLTPARYEEDLQDIIRSLRNVSPDLISAIDVQHYVKRALHDPNLQTLLGELILRRKTHYTEMACALRTVRTPLGDFFTHDPKQFEDGLAQVLIGTEAQQTGYSHEFVGAIVDTSLLSRTHQFVSCIEDPQQYYLYLQYLLQHSFSYDEKNQIGGRALRTASGTASYIEYLSPNYDRESIFNIETSFNDILIEDKALAANYRNSVMFNRMTLGLLNNFDGSFEMFVDHVATHCQTHGLYHHYQPLLQQRLPQWWALKHQADLLRTQDFANLQAVAVRALAQRNVVLPDIPTHDGWMNRQNNPPVFFNISLWLTWMTQPRSMIIGVMVVLAGLGILAATSVGIMATALVINCSKGLIVTGSLLFLAAASRSCYTFFQRRNIDPHPPVMISSGVPNPSV